MIVILHLYFKYHLCLNCDIGLNNRIGGTSSCRPLTPPYVPFGIRRFESFMKLYLLVISNLIFANMHCLTHNQLQGFWRCASILCGYWSSSMLCFSRYLASLGFGIWSWAFSILSIDMLLTCAWYVHLSLRNKTLYRRFWSNSPPPLDELIYFMDSVLHAYSPISVRYFL